MWSVRPGTIGAPSGFTSVARLSPLLFTLVLLGVSAPAAAETPAVTLAPLPGADACLSRSPGDSVCTTIRKPIYDTLAFELSGDGRHAYLLSWGYGYPSSIHLFSRNRFDGALTEEDACWSTEARDDCAVDPLLEDAADLTISPDRQYVYVVGAPTPENGDDNGMGFPPPSAAAILVFARNALSGELTRVQCLAARDLAGCDRVSDLGEFAVGKPIVSPDGRHVYVGPAVFDRDPATGHLEGYRCAYEAGPDDDCPDGYVTEMSPDGRFGYASDGRLTTFSRDPASGALSRVACPDGQDCRPTPYGGDFPGIFSAFTVAPDGKNVYAAGWYLENQAWVYDFDADPGTGLLAQRGCFQVGEFESECDSLLGVVMPGAVSASPDGQAVYVPSASVEWDNGGGISMFARDPVTGRLTWAGCITRDGSGGTCVQDPALGSTGLAVVSPDSRNVYAVSSGLISVLGLAVDVRAEELQVSERGRIRPRLICPTGVTRCEGRISFKRRRLTVARKQFSVPGGETTRIRVRLSERGLEKIQRKSRLRTNAKVTAASVPGRTVRAVKLSTRPGPGSR